MRIGRLFERQARADLDVHAACQPVERRPRGVPIRADVPRDETEHARPRERDRTGRPQLVEIERLPRADRGHLPDARDHPERTNRAERAGQHVAADSVDRVIDARTAAEGTRGRDEIRLAIIDHRFRAVRAHQRGFRRRSDRADHPCAERARPLRRQQPDAAGRRMHEHRVAGADLPHAMQQHVDGDPLQQPGDGGFVAQPVWNRQHALGRHRAQARIAAGRHAGIRDALTGHELRHARPDRVDHAGRLDAERVRQRGQCMRARPEIDIDEIHADRGLANPYFAGAGRRDGRIDAAQHAGIAVTVDPDPDGIGGLGHDVPRYRMK
ncbi:hypothetical protein BURCENK562V_C3939 [Burkholderia cenocepacia K56-2Valvano]|nr:hypothetical protein BURCENK562V_C3939 [Burkholderia cenocepacia K56-2Valvano]